MSNNKYFIFFFFILGLVLLGVFGYMFTDLKYLGGTFKNVSNTPTYTQADVEDLFNKGDFVNLNRTLDEQLLSYPQDTFLLLQKAHALSQEASLTFKEKELGDQAREYAQRVLNLDSDNVQALTIIGYTYEIQEDYVNAHKYYDDALFIDPNSVVTLAQKAHAYDLQGKIDQAEKIYLSIIESKDVSSDVLLKYSRILQMRGKQDEAIKLLNENIDKIQNSRIKAETYFMLGQNLQTDDYNSKSNDYFNLARETDPSFPMSYVGLAQESFKKSFVTTDTTEKDSLIENSFYNLKEAINLNPNQSLGLLELARQLIALGQIDQAKIDPDPKFSALFLYNYTHKYTKQIWENEDTK